MLNLIKNLIQVLTPEQRKKLYVLQVLVIISAIFEVLSVLSIGPFMAIVGNIDLVESNLIINKLYIISGATNNIEFLFYVGLGVLVLMFSAAITSIVTIWKLSMYAANVGSEFGDRLYEHYIRMDYQHYTTINSANLVKKIATEVNRVTDNVLQPLVQINARLATILFISIFVFIYNPMVAIVGVTVLCVAYFILFSIVKNRLAVNGKLISEYSRKRFTLMNEGFGAIKELQILGREHYFIREFEKSGKVFAASYGSSNSLYNMPRYFMEFVVYSSMVALILLLLKTYDSDLSSVLPILGVFGIAAFKLLPSFQQVYSGAAQLRSNISAFRSLEDDLRNANTGKDKPIESFSDDKLVGSLKLENISFRYKGSENNTLDNISLEIPLKSTIGIVGPSGSGKSTLLDILIGSLSIDSGKLLIGDSELNKHNLRLWRNGIGYVSQMSLIKDGTISENIAFGLKTSDIDMVQLRSATDMAQLTDWIMSLPEGFDTKVGEKGVQISGGQRQRIAIARALYNNADYLFFDEATSALDGVTEEQIMQSIANMAGLKTIVMIAHRFNTIRNCDQIYYIEAGKVVAFGTYNQLISQNDKFKKMAGGKL